MRVLLCAAPAFGHFLPTLPTARALVAAGHEVRVATHAGFHPVVEAAGLKAVGAGMSDDDMLAERLRRWPETDGRPASEWAVRMFADIAAPAMLSDLDRIVGEWCPELVIHEEGEYASPVAAAAAGIPWVTSGWGSPLRRPADLGPLQREVAELWRSRGLDVPPRAGLYRYAVVDPCPRALQPDIDDVPNRLAVRFEPYETGGESTLDCDRPVAYVGFGTTTLYRDPPDLLQAVVRALLDEGFGVVATVSDDALADRLRALSPGEVDVDRFVSLAAVLAAAALVVCHGGAGTTLAALHDGVPLVIAPQGSPSQARMASACERAGVATVVSRQATADQLREAIRASSGDRARRRAALIAEEMAVMPDAALLVPALEGLAARPA